MGTMPGAAAPRRPRMRHFRNLISWAGLLLAASALFAFCFLFAIDQFAGNQNAYIGILSYVVAPGFFFLGIALTLLGALLHWRTERRASATHAALRIDLSRPRDRKV